MNSFNLKTLIFLSFFLWNNPAIAQIIPDETLGNENSIVNTTGNISRITGGATRNENLFHSFQEFNVEQGGRAIFSTPEGIKTIFSRVTGLNPSQIDGILQVTNDANLFFLNPQGVIFGQNAVLQIGGSFVATTGSSFIFPEGQEYSAINPQLPPLLTINIPIGVQFRQTANNIVINNNRNQIRLSNEGKTLALIGGEINLNNSLITTPNEGGKIGLFSVGNDSEISINETEGALNFATENISNWQNINLTEGSLIKNTLGDIVIAGKEINLTEGSQIFTEQTKGNTGNILLQGKESITLTGTNNNLPSAIFSRVKEESLGENSSLIIDTPKLIIKDGAQISTDTEGDFSGVNLLIPNSKLIEITGVSEDKTLQSGIFSQVTENALGNSGNITINTEELIVKEGAQISSSTLGQGNAGNIKITANNLVLDGNVKDALITSGIFAQVAENATGNGGNIDLKTTNLTATNGGVISAATSGGGSGGNIRVESEQITLNGIAATAKIESIAPTISEIRGRSGVFVSSQPNAQNNAGNVEIKATDLIVENGAKIASETFSQGSAGNTTLNVDNLMISNGGLIRAGTFDSGNAGEIIINNSNSVKITGSQNILGETFNSSLSSAATDQGNAGNVTINSNILNVENKGEISLSSTGEGAAGNLIVNVPNITLNEGNMTGNNTAGLGNITVNTNNIQLRNNSNITTNSTGIEPGGNIEITTDNIIMRESNISANATNSRGGRVIINTEGLFVTPESTITATSELGEEFNGVVEINNPDVDPSNALVKLPENVVDPVSLIAQNACKQGAESQFTITGKGGIAPTPNDFLIPQSTEVDLVTPINSPPKETIDKNSQLTPEPKITPARGLSVNDKGEIILVGFDPAQPQSSRSINQSNCQVNK